MNPARIFLTVLAIAALMAGSAAPAKAASQVEPVMSYQGFLATADGTPLNGAFDMNFLITDSPDTLWQEFHPAVQVNDGFFSVVLGETDPIPTDALASESDEEEYAVRHLQVQVDSDPPMSPSSRLLTAPYSVASRRMAGDIFTSPGSIRMGVEPVPFLPLMEMHVVQDSASIRMGVEPDPFSPTVEINTNPNTTSFRMGVEPQPFNPAVEMNVGQNTTTFAMGVEPDPFDPAPEFQMLMDQNSSTFRMGVDPEPFHPTVEINSSPNITSFSMGIEPEPFDPAPEITMMMDENSTTFSMGIDPEPFNPTAEINSSLNTTTFRMGIEPQPFNPAPEFEMLMDQNSSTFRMGIDPTPFNPAFEMNADLNSSTFRMGIDPTPFNPSAEISALTNQTSFSMFDPSATSDSKTVSQMIASAGGQFGWDLSLPGSGSPRQVMDMNTGPGGEISWIMFNPQPEPPGEPLIKMVTYGDPAGADIQLFEPPPGTAVYPNVDIYTEDGQGGIILRQSASGYIANQTPSSLSFTDGGSGQVKMALNANSSSYMIGNFALGTSNATNILTIQQGSATDPIADSWMVYTLSQSEGDPRTIDGALDKVLQLRGVTNDGITEGSPDIGFVAEEVAEVLPNVVAYDKDGGEAIGIDYGRLTPLLVEAIKTQQGKIDELESEIAELRQLVLSLAKNDR